MAATHAGIVLAVCLCLCLFVLFVSGCVRSQVLQEGSGPTPTPGANITVHCTGYLASGKKFWRYGT